MPPAPRSSRNLGRNVQQNMPTYRQEDTTPKDTFLQEGGGIPEYGGQQKPESIESRRQEEELTQRQREAQEEEYLSGAGEELSTPQERVRDRLRRVREQARAFREQQKQQQRFRTKAKQQQQLTEDESQKYAFSDKMIKALSVFKDFLDVIMMFIPVLGWWLGIPLVSILVGIFILLIKMLQGTTRFKRFVKYWPFMMIIEIVAGILPTYSLFTIIVMPYLDKKAKELSGTPRTEVQTKTT